ncbi:Abca4, partial [Symbiodinium sp. CCMP2456]
AEQSRTLDLLIHSHCSRAELLSDVGTELTYRMPFEESGNFPKLFESLETRPESYGIQLFGVSVTTLEEVFLRVGRDHTEADIAADERLQQASFVRQISAEREERALGSFTQRTEEQRSSGSAMAEPLTAERRPDPSVSFQRHVHAMLVKRFHNARRDRKAWCCQIVLPLIFLLMALMTMRFAGIGDYE